MVKDIQIIKKLKDELQDVLGDLVLEVILFGSRSTEIADEFSDFDVLIILKQEPDWNQKRKISEICYDIELQSDILIDSHILSVSEVGTLRGKQPIFQRAILEGIHV
ncbi:MAG: nucleotidyltransferase domain-containing protein [Bacteroidota bacterium]|nr:nucleotidyltransferase domain-containing protein [Bacteroidota bacterium]